MSGIEIEVHPNVQMVGIGQVTLVLVDPRKSMPFTMMALVNFVVIRIQIFHLLRLFFVLVISYKLALQVPLYLISTGIIIRHLLHRFLSQINVQEYGVVHFNIRMNVSIIMLAGVVMVSSRTENLVIQQPQVNHQQHVVQQHVNP